MPQQNGNIDFKKMAEVLETVTEEIGKGNGILEAIESKAKDLVQIEKTYPAIFKPFEVQIEGMVKMAKEWPAIQTEEKAQGALTLAAEARRLAKQIEEKRDEITRYKFVQKVRSFAKGFLDKLETVDDAIKARLKEYNTWKRLEEEKAKKLADAAAAEAQKKMNAEAKKIGLSPSQTPQMPAPLIPPAKKTVRDETGAVSYERSVWLHEVTDLNLVPDEYWKLDEAMIKNAIKMGARSIPGLRIFEDKDPVIRS